MAASRDELKKIARLKLVLRRTDAEIAEEMLVSRATIQRWIASSAYGSILQEVRSEWREAARSRVTGLVDDVMQTLHDILLYSNSDRNKIMAAELLGRWAGLEEPEKSADANGSTEAIMLLRQLAAQPQPQILLPPPGPGGSLPRLTGITEAEIVEPLESPVDS